MVKGFHIITFLLLLVFLIPQEADGQLEQLQRRFFKKSKIRKAGKKLTKLGDEKELEEYTIQNGLEVIGYEPSWNIEVESPAFEQYYFNLLTGLITGEFDINPEKGTPRNKESLWVGANKIIRDKSMPKNAKKTNIYKKAYYFKPSIKFLTAVTYTGDYKGGRNRQKYFEKLFKESETRNNLVTNVADYLDSLSYYLNIPESNFGIVIDFDNLPSNVKDEFLILIEEFREKLVDKYIILKLPARTNDELYLTREEIEKLEELDLVDLYILESSGYEYSKKVESLHTANFLGDSLSYCTLNSIIHYINAGISSEKMILDIPYHGLAWTKNDRGQFQLSTDKSHVTLDEINKAKGKMGVVNYDIDTTEAYLEVHDIEGLDTLSTTVYCFDDSKTLFNKYSWVIDSIGLKGISVGALGYSSFYNKKELKLKWAAIAYQFGKVKPSSFYLYAGFVSLFFPMGFVFSIFKYWEVRNALAKYRDYFRWFLLFFSLALLVMCIFNFELVRGTVGYGIGLIITGLFALYMAFRRFLSRIRRYTRYVK